MRELTIRRVSGRLLQLCSAEFWVEDPDAVQQEIEGVGCRLLGTIEPEKERTFRIPEKETTVFVRMDWHGQIITAGSLKLPEGEDPVACKAKDQMLPGERRNVSLSIVGSGVERKPMDQYQKAERVRKIVLVFSILAGIGIGLFFASRRPPTPKTITFDADGLQLTLSSSFQESGDRAEGFSRAYYSNDSAVQVARYPISETDGMTLEEFAASKETWLAPDGWKQLADPQQPLCYEYTFIADDGDSHTDLAAFYVGTDAFWLVRYDCETDDYPEEHVEYLESAASVTVP